MDIATLIFPARKIVFLCLLFWIQQASGASYALNPPHDQPALCNQQQGHWSGNTYICNWNQPFTLSPGDTITSSRNIKILSYSGFTIRGATLGGNGNTIDIEAQGSSRTILTDTTLFGSVYGQHNVFLQGKSTVNGEINISSRLDTSQSLSSTITGNVSANNGITAANTTFHANLTSSNSGITLTGGLVTNDVLVKATSIVATNTVFQGTLTSTNGSITLTGGSAAGLIKSDCCSVKINRANIFDGIEAKSGIDINGRDSNGTCSSQLEIQGDIRLTGLNPVSFDCVNMTQAKEIGIAGSATFKDSTIGAANILVTVQTEGSAYVTLTNSFIYGNVIVPEYGQWDTLIRATDAVSRIYGSCQKVSTGVPNTKYAPATLCGNNIPVPATAIVYKLSYPPQPLTCDEVPVMISTYDSTGNPLTSQASVSLSPAHMWIGGTSHTFTGNTVAYLKRQPGTYILGVNSASPAMQNLICSSSDCRIILHDSGFILNVPNLIAGVSDTATIRAVKTDDSTKKCVPGFADGSREILFQSSYLNPASGTLFPRVSTPSSTKGPLPDNETKLALSFDNNATAHFEIQYDDVGALTLNASYTGIGDEQDLQMSGSSNFITRPHTLAVTKAFTDNSLNPGTTDTNDSIGFIAAGEDFSVMIAAFNENGQPTPNFGKETPRQLAEAHFGRLVYPLAGSDGNVAAGIVNTTLLASNGQQQVDKVSWDEVGSIRLTARLAGDSYLGTGDVVAKPESDVIGRFYPHHFALASSEVKNSCQQFSYMSHNNLTLNYHLQAKNKQTKLLQNYDTDIYAGTAQIGVMAFDAAIDLGYSRFSVNSTKWQHGEYSITQSDAEFKRSSLPDGPYSNLQPGLSILSEKDNRQFLSVDLGNSSIKLNGTLDMRFGRMILKNTYGPEHENLPLHLNAEYWQQNLNQFTTNINDNCSELSAARLNPISFTPEHPITGATEVTASGNAQQTTLINGSSIIHNLPAIRLDASNQRGEGSVTYQVPVWLQYNWSGSATANDEHPEAHFIFGRYRGNPRQIFWREPF